MITLTSVIIVALVVQYIIGYGLILYSFLTCSEKEVELHSATMGMAALLGIIPFGFLLLGILVGFGQLLLLSREAVQLRKRKKREQEMALKRAENVLKGTPEWMT